MPAFLDGQQNLSALSVPGVYVDIILPQPLLIGPPTNVEGLVGVTSWGPTNAVVYASQLSDAALNLGPPQIRTYDITSHIAAATQVGSSIAFACVRVTDGSDTAAQQVIKDTGGTVGITLTAKYTGTLGNSIQASIQNGSQLNTLMAVVSSQARSLSSSTTFRPVPQTLLARLSSLQTQLLMPPSLLAARQSLSLHLEPQVTSVISVLLWVAHYRTWRWSLMRLVTSTFLNVTIRLRPSPARLPFRSRIREPLVIASHWQQRLSVQLFLPLLLQAARQTRRHSG